MMFPNRHLMAIALADKVLRGAAAMAAGLTDKLLRREDILAIMDPAEEPKSAASTRNEASGGDTPGTR